MKKIFFFTAITVLMLSSSCKKEVTPLSKDRTATERISSSGAVPFHGSYDVIRDGQQFYNSCTNELVTVYGNEQVIFHGLSNGSKSTITFNVNIPGTIRGADESGREYIINEHLLYQESHFADGVFSTKLVATLRWITEGGSNNFIHEETFYVKVDADGNVTVIREPISEDYCQ